MCADLMNAEKDEYQRIRDLRKRQPLSRNCQHYDKHSDKDVFEGPIPAIERVYGQNDPLDREYGRQDRQQTITMAGQTHRRRHRCSFMACSGLFAIIGCAILAQSPASAASCDQPPTEVFNGAAESVVRVFAVAIDPFRMTERVQTAIGTGIVIDDQGHIVTNAHLVFEASQVMVSQTEEEMIEATVVGFDAITDLAVIVVEPSELKSPPATLGHSADLAIGEEVMAIGYPFGIGKTATRGIISALERVVPLSPFSWQAPFIQTDAAVNPGNSGGPLLDSCGDVIGMNTLSTELGQNLSFAVPIDLVSELLPQLIEKGHISRAWHGINGRVVPLPLAFALGIPPGFLVETIEPGSPAATIGLRGGNFPVIIGGAEFLLGGDVIVNVNGEPLTSTEIVTRIARSLKIGDEVQLEYLHEGELMSAKVVLPERPMLPGDVRRFRERRGIR
jgi:S1-C subfamily serine protease